MILLGNVPSCLYFVSERLTKSNRYYWSFMLATRNEQALVSIVEDDGRLDITVEHGPVIEFGLASGS